MALTPTESGLGAALTFLQQHDACKSIIEVPQIYRRHAALVVQLAVDIEGLIGLDLHLSDPLTWYGTLARTVIAAGANAARAALVQGWVKLVRPWRAVRIAVSVVVAEEVVSARLLASLNNQGLID